jgi:hypothetical protein
MLSTPCAGLSILFPSGRDNGFLVAGPSERVPATVRKASVRDAGPPTSDEHRARQAGRKRPPVVRAADSNHSRIPRWRGWHAGLRRRRAGDNSAAATLVSPGGRGQQMSRRYPPPGSGCSTWFRIRVIERLSSSPVGTASMPLDSSAKYCRSPRAWKNTLASPFLTTPSLVAIKLP